MLHREILKDWDFEDGASISWFTHRIVLQRLLGSLQTGHLPQGRVRCYSSEKTHLSWPNKSDLGWLYAIGWSNNGTGGGLISNDALHWRL